LPETLTYPASTAALPSSRFKVQYEYAYGSLKAVKDFNTPGTVYWQAVQTNAANQTTESLLGNGLRTYATHDAVTGLLRSIVTGTNGVIQNMSYQWDKMGNLTQRKDEGRSLTETFTYDDLYRMTDTRLNGALTLHVDYNSIGNIVSRSDLSGTFAYPASGTNSVRPHAVTQVGTAPAYQYDANGNMTSRNGSNINWTSFNLPSQINSGANSSQFTYGPDRQRWKHVANTAGSIETTISIGGLFEKVTRGSTVDHRHYIPVDGGNVIRTVRVTGGSTTLHTYYSSSDHLGSADAITNESGAILVRESFGPFGARRGSNWVGGQTSPEMVEIANASRDGFTGHEMLDSVGLIHMNGRVYDQQIGRFISADPFVQDEFDSQSLNRYSYVNNNPLSNTDPHRWISPGAYATPYIDRFLIKNPKAASYIGSMYGGWVGLGLNAHIARINGGEPIEIVVAGVLGYFFGGGGYNYELGGGSGGGGISGWGPRNGIAGPSALSPDVSDANRPKMDQDLTIANAFLTRRYFSSEVQAVQELHRVAGVITKRYGVEVFARIYQINESRGRSFFFVGQVTTSYAKGSVGSADQARSIFQYTGRRRVRYVANWHTHPSDWSNDFSDRFSNDGQGDIVSYTRVTGAQNGYVSLIHRDIVLKFDWNRWQKENGGYRPTETDRFKCAIRGSHSQYPACP
jgi:RHS repeat-associated protein